MSLCTKFISHSTTFDAPDSLSLSLCVVLSGIYMCRIQFCCNVVCCTLIFHFGATVLHTYRHNFHNKHPKNGHAVHSFVLSFLFVSLFFFNTLMFYVKLGLEEIRIWMHQSIANLESLLKFFNVIETESQQSRVKYKCCNADLLKCSTLIHCDLF